jgi:hypothetical protein
MYYASSANYLRVATLHPFKFSFFNPVFKFATNLLKFVVKYECFTVKISSFSKDFPYKTCKSDSSVTAAWMLKYLSGKWFADRISLASTSVKIC